MKNRYKKEFSIIISSWTQRALDNIQAKTGIPAQIWAESELIKAIYQQLDFDKDQPKNRRGR